MFVALLYLWVGIAAHGWDRVWALGGGVIILAAVAVARRSFIAALTLLVIGALPLALSTWWSIATPVLAILAVILGWFAIRNVTRQSSPPREHRFPDIPRRPDSVSGGTSEQPLEPWLVSETEYPRAGTIGEQLQFLLRYAILAPSGHNTQPWLFRIVDDTVELYADRSRALPVVDPDDRELIISCGAALATLEIAIQHFGHPAVLDVAPDPGNADLLARITVAGVELAPRRRSHDRPHEDELFAAITQRHSNRSAFRDRDVPPWLDRRMVTDASSHGVWLCLVRGENRAAVADLIAEGDRIQMADKRFRRELAAWVHPNRSRTRDGMRGYGFGSANLMSYAGPQVIRSFDLGKGQAAKDHELAQHSPLLAVVGTPRDDQNAWLSCGRALQRALLQARAADVWSSHLNQPIEVEELRPRLAQLVGRAGEYPQLLLRFGFGSAVKAQPRRTVEEVTVETLPASADGVGQ